MRSIALQPDSAWAEDRALLRSNPSADPGAETECHSSAWLRCDLGQRKLRSGIGTKAKNLRGRSREICDRKSTRVDRANRRAFGFTPQHNS